MFDIEAELKKLPKKPGVYIMHDKNDKIIYVGKAVVLRNRVRQYFRKNKKTKRIQNMVALVDHFEYIVCDNEAEALILECNLIKKNMPKFNVLLKDDKTYPYIKINVKADYPDLYITRRILNDGAKYFGPYANAGSAKEMIEFIKSRYKIRQCRSFKYKDRPCLNYHIKKCMAPCMGYISKEDYRKQIDEIISILEGKTDNLKKELEKEMLEALGLKESGLDKVIKASYDLLGLMSFLTAGEPEVRAWTIKKGTKAPQAAGKIHSDIERGFIRAEIVSYDDLIREGSINSVKEKGLMRSEGKEYVIQDGDVVLFRFNV